MNLKQKLVKFRNDLVEGWKMFCRGQEESWKTLGMRYNEILKENGFKDDDKEEKKEGCKCDCCNCNCKKEEVEALEAVEPEFDLENKDEE